MLSVAKLTVGQERYYEQQVATGIDDYYAGRGESPGMWAGLGAEGLGLDGVAGDGKLGELLRGNDPGSGRVLRAPVRARIVTATVLDAETRQLRFEPKRLAPVSGYDLVFSCPKSVSLLHALTDDEGVRRAVSEAHEASWQAALAYLEQEACVTRRGAGGVLREHGEGFVAAAFRHRTSRAQDPHLHTHVIVANMAKSPDGEWRALDGRALLQTYRLAAGYLYEAQLRFELTRRLGVEWTEPSKGMGELRGVPEEALHAFSRRRVALVERLKTEGLSGFRAARVSALATRERKQETDLPTLREDWRARAAEYCLGVGELQALLDRGPWRGLDEDEAAELAAHLISPSGLTEKQTTFTMLELVKAVAEGHAQGASIEEVVAVSERIASLPGLRLVEDGSVPGRPARLTTEELLTIESDALQRALAGRHVEAPQASDFEMRRAVTRSPLALSPEQRTLVQHSCESRDRVVCVVGRAGSGKTTAIQALGEAFACSSVPVLGAAPSGRAAEELHEATGIESTTLHRLLLRAADDGLPDRCLLVVDEAGMAETRVLAPILRMVEEADGKALLVGDPSQLPAVGAGGLFAALADQLGALELAENRRQLDPDERRALARLRAGEADEYLAFAAERGRLAVCGDPSAARSRLLGDWWQGAQRDLAGSVMLAYRRADVAELNAAARTLMDAQSRLGRDRLIICEREFAPGDRVVCRRNADVLGVKNGTRGTLDAIDRENRALRLVTDRGEQRTLPAWYVSAGFLEHGYALTGHAAQGATIDRAFVLATGEGALREWGYVTFSRARAETHLYVTEAELAPETTGRSAGRENQLDHLRRGLETPAAESLALDQARNRAAQRLEAAERELTSLSWRFRGRRKELRREVEFHRTALKIGDDTRVRLSERPRTRRPSAEWSRAHEHAGIQPSFPPRSLEPPGQGIEL